MTMSRRFAALSAALLTLTASACTTSTSTTSVSAAPATLDELAKRSLARIDGELNVPGLKESVEIIRDQQGIPHIYAKNDADMFFAQGYVMAQDRLWQLEMWRRWREGRLAEIFGPKAYDYDARTRLMMFRGPWDEKEWSSYHPDAERLFGAWASGLNAYVAQHADNLPVEFTLTGIRPEPWTARTLTLRWAELAIDSASGTPTDEIRLAREVAALGVKEANRKAAPDPWDDLVVPDGLDLSILPDTLLDVMRTGEGDPFRPDALPPLEIVAQYRDLVPPLKTARCLARTPGHGRQQQLGRERQALSDGCPDRRQRSASDHRDAVASLLRAPGVAGVERRRWRRATVCRRGRGQQRPHGVGVHVRRHRHGRHLRRGDEPGRYEPGALQGRVGADEDHPRGGEGQR